MVLALVLLVDRPADAAEPVDYVRDIKPLLAVKCYACHGALKQESGLRLDTAALALKGGESGLAVVVGKSAASAIVARVSTNDVDERMPPEGQGEPLDAKQIALLKAWIDQGAKAPNEPIPPDPREHWAYQVPVRPALPAVKNTGWVRNPIDAFIAAGHEQQGLQPVGSAEKHVLLRRVYLDLIGLPPTRQQLQQYLASPSGDAYDAVVNELLDSPHYGERWGRHWMDVWRYSDWAGYRNEIRNSQRHIWRWRDWIIESLNEDKGYDRMILEMLAGDELAPGDPQTLRATGFLARNWFKFNRNSWLDNTIEHTAKAFLGMTINCARCHDHKYDPIAQRSYYQMRAVFEPHNVLTDRVPGQSDLLKDGLPRVYDANATTPTYLFASGNEKRPDKEHPLAPAFPDILRAELDIQPVSLPVDSYYPHLREFAVNEMLETSRAATKKAEQGLAAAIAKRDAAAETLKGFDKQGETKQSGESADDKSKPAAQLTPELAKRAYEDAVAGVDVAELNAAAAKISLSTSEARIAADRAKYAVPPDEKFKELAQAAGRAERELAVAQARLALRNAERAFKAAQHTGDPNDKKVMAAVGKAGAAVKSMAKTLQAAEAKLEKADARYKPLGSELPRTSTGRRLALARRIADKQNPLTARVAVNHIWLRHFGAPLVANVFDFGLRSPRPRHAELLDWLAVEFMEGGWSMKKLHRLIVTSNAYRMKSGSRDAPADNLSQDPDNHFLWRMNSRRLEAELVRDSILHVAGSLDTTRGGPVIDQNQGQTSLRRSVYFRHAYEKKMKFLELFDGPSENECYRRSESVVPQQALALANSALSFGQSRKLARTLATESAKQDDPDTAFVNIAFEHVLSRQPTAAELAQCRDFLTAQAKLLSDRTKLTASVAGPAARVKPSGDPALRARENLIHVLMNHNDFVTIR